MFYTNPKVGDLVLGLTIEEAKKTNLSMTPGDVKSQGQITKRVFKVNKIVDSDRKIIEVEALLGGEIFSYLFAKRFKKI